MWPSGCAPTKYERESVQTTSAARTTTAVRPSRSRSRSRETRRWSRRAGAAARLELAVVVSIVASSAETSIVSSTGGTWSSPVSVVLVVGRTAPPAAGSRRRRPRTPASPISNSDDGDVVLAAAAGSPRRRGPGRSARGSSRFRSTMLEDRPVVDHRGEAVGAEHEDVAGAGLDRERVHVDLGVGAEHARDHRALGVDLGLLAREAAAADELGDERVVLGQLLERARRGRGRRASRRRGRCGPRRSSTSAAVIVVPIPTRASSVGGGLVHAPVRLLDQRDDRVRRSAGRRCRAAPMRRSARRSRRPARRPCRRRPRRAAARARTRPRCAAGAGRGR